MFDEIRKLSIRFLTTKNNLYQRYLIRTKNFNDSKLSLIVGQRGVGKTTALIQYLLANVKNDILSNKILYVQSDHFQIGKLSLYDIAEEFVNYGGK